MSHSKVILVLGAGATVGAGFKVRHNDGPLEPPLDRNFFESKAVEPIFIRDRFPVLYHYQRGEEKELETLWSKVDLYHKLCRSGIVSEEHTFLNLAKEIIARAQDDHAYRRKMEQESRNWCVPSLGGWELLHLVSEVFKGLHHTTIEESPLHKIISRLQGEKLLDAIVTFNYDTSVEQLLPDCFYYPLLLNQDAKGKLPLIKLHGSLNWQADSRSLPRISVMEPITKMAEMDHDGDRWRQPEVIGPTFFKQEINLDFEIPDDFRAPYYKSLWRIAWDRLKVAEYLVFVGFSFAETDFHARVLFRSAHFSGFGFRQVIVCHRGSKELMPIVRRVFAGGRSEVQPKECDEGLESMADRLDELVALLQN